MPGNLVGNNRRLPPPRKFDALVANLFFARGLLFDASFLPVYTL
jgi:hypothetical protein